MSIHDVMFNHVRRIRAQRAAILERACEMSIQGGVCGVLSVTGDDGSYSARPDITVPYGMIYEIREATAR